MKIEKGKLYYDTKTEQLFKAPNYGGTAREGITDKIAVHCPTEDDFNYVTNFQNYNWSEDFSGRWDLLLFKKLNYISLCINQRGSQKSYMKLGYHIITISDFKSFYPPISKEEQKESYDDPYNWVNNAVAKQYLNVVKECENELKEDKPQMFSGGMDKDNKEDKIINTQPHYDNSKGSLYQIAEQRGWNSYQFDICKRIDRALKKGQFKEDLKKTKDLIDLWLREYEN